MKRDDPTEAELPDDEAQMERALRVWSAEPVPAEDIDAAEARRARLVPALAGAIREAGARRERDAARRRALGAVALAAAVALGGVGAWRWLSPAGSTSTSGAQLAAAPSHGSGAGEAPPRSEPSAAASADPVRGAADHARVATLRATAGDVVVKHAGRSSVASAGAEVALEAGDEVATSPDARALVQLESGAVVEAWSASSVKLFPPSAPAAPGAQAEPGERVALGAGRISVTVPVLEPGRSFRVLAPSAEVVVHGTAFDVAVTGDAAAAEPLVTSVSVTEGLVSVRHTGDEIFVRPGERWLSSAPDATSATASADEPPARAAAPRAPAKPAPLGAAPAPANAREAASQLADQNRMFQAAMAAKRRGDDRAVVQTLDLLLARYPSSPLAQEARVERMRALGRLGDHAGAARDARRYLVEHRDGFARDEAKDVALDPAASASAPPKRP